MDTPQRLTLERFKEAAVKARDDGAETGPIVIPKGMAVEVKAVEGEDRVREFIASTAGVDRDGDTIAVDGWELQNFAKAGVFLWAHDRQLPPVGDPFATFVEGPGLKTRVRFPARDFPHPLGMGFGDTVMRMYDERLMKAVSVGLLPIEWSFNEERGGFMPMDFKRQELVEISAVPVPSNPDALAIARSKGIDTAPIIAWAETVRDADTGLWIPKDAIESLLEQAAGEKAISIPSPTPDPDPVRTPSSTEPGEATTDPATAYAAATKAAEDAEAEIIKSICACVEALGGRKQLVSDANADRLREALVKVAGLVTTKAPAEPTTPPAEPGAGDQSATITVEGFRALAQETVDKLLAQHTGRLPF